MKRIDCGVMVIALCISLAVMPADASDFTLEIFGNANMDDTIDEQDIEYVQAIIDGTNDETDLADANYDGTIDEDDIVQIEQIISGVEKELTLIDSAERVVTVQKPVSRIVLTHPHTLETLRTLDVPTDLIVGIAQDKYDRSFFPEFSDVPSIGWRWTPNVEEIVKLRPDVVILYGRGGSQGNLDQVQDVLESSEITVLRFNCNNVDTYADEIEKLGYVFDKQDEAEEFLDWRDEILNSIKVKVDRISDEDKPNVYFEWYTAYYTSNYGYIEMAGGKNIFENVSGDVNPEAVADRNPDIIVRAAPWTFDAYGVDAGDTAELEDTRTEVLSRDILQCVPAVEEENVRIIADQLLSGLPVSGCRQFLQLAYQAKWFHPELFEDLDPQAIHQEYLTRFQGLDYDLEEHGVFVYPPLEER
jgi:iron complex transport system substrate-binding protein